MPDAHPLSIVHGYGSKVNIILDGMKLRDVISYSVKGENNKLPEFTVTMNVSSVIYDTKSGKESEREATKENT